MRRPRVASQPVLAGAVLALLLAGCSEALAQVRRGGGGAGALDDIGPGAARSIDDLGKVGAGARRGDFPPAPPLVAPRPAPRSLSLRARPQPPTPPDAARAAPTAPPPPAQARVWLSRTPPVAAPARSASEGGARAARPALPARVDPAALASAGRPRSLLASAAPPRDPPIDAAAQRLWREAVALGKVKGVDDLPFDELSLAARDAKLFSRTPAAFLPEPPIRPSRLDRTVRPSAYFFLGTTVITQISTAIGLPVQGQRDRAQAAALLRNLLVHNSGQGRITVAARDAAGQSTVLGYVEAGGSRSFSAARSAEIVFSSADRRPLDPQRIVLDEDAELRL